jgi:ubiquitin-like protein Pup
VAEQERIQKQRTERTESSAATDDVALDAQKGEQLKAELDDLLDEIDEVLEQNAEEFVRNYVQKGGQ